MAGSSPDNSADFPTAPAGTQGDGSGSGVAGFDDFEVVVSIDNGGADGDGDGGSPVLVVRIAGELDMATAPILLAHVPASPTPDGVGASLVRFELDALAFIDASGLRALSTVADGRPALVVGARPATRRLFEIAGVTGQDGSLGRQFRIH